LEKGGCGEPRSRSSLAIETSALTFGAGNRKSGDMCGFPCRKAAKEVYQLKVVCGIPHAKYKIIKAAKIS